MQRSDYANRVAAAVRAEMARAGETQISLAAKLGRTQSSLSRRLTGQIAFSVSELEQIAGHLDVPLDVLVDSGPKAATA